MARYTTALLTDQRPAEAFAYLADLRNFAAWDPGVRRVEQIDGVGAGPDTTFDVTVAGIGRDLTLRYRTVRYEAPRQVLVEARSAMFTSTDVITVEVTADGTLVTYDAELKLNGALALGDPLLRLVFGRIGDRAASGLRDALDGSTVVP